MEFPTYEQMAKDVAEKALDEILYDGRTIREWIRIIAEQDLLKAELKTQAEYKAFAEWVAKEVFSDIWELNKDSFQEIACRKLNKLGIVARLGDSWWLPESEE